MAMRADPEKGSRGEARRRLTVAAGVFGIAVLGVAGIATRYDRPPSDATIAVAPDSSVSAVADPARERAWVEYLSPLFAEFGATPPTSLREIYASFVTDDSMLALLLEQKPTVVSFHFGLPAVSWIERLQAAGIVTLASATTPDEAAQCQQAGVDAIVALLDKKQFKLVRDGEGAACILSFPCQPLDD